MMVSLAGERLTLGFGMVDGGFALTGFSRPGGAEFCAPGPGLWRVELINTENEVIELRPQTEPKVQRGAGTIRCRWRFSGRAEVMVSVDSEPGSDAAALRIMVEKVAPEWSVRGICFPWFDWVVDDGEACRLILPEDAGAVYPDPLRTLPSGGVIASKRLRERAWPNGNFTMQFAALERSGELGYFGAHDPEAAVKSFACDCDREGRRVVFRPRWHTVRRPGADYRSFPWVLALSHGDWFDAAQRYRRFALTAPWLSRGPLEAGRKTPQWLLETPLVTLRMHRGDGCSAADIRREAEFFGVPVLVHYYMWQRNAFDANNPFFFPTVPGFRREVKTLRDAGIRVMPYVNFFSADSSLAEWPQLESSSLRTDEFGGTHRTVWSQHREDFVQMCSGAPLWRRIAAMQTLRMLETGVSGIYFDEIGMSPPFACCADNHDHEAGDPETFVRCGCRLFRKIRNEAEEFVPEPVFASEGAGEPFIAEIDTLLTGNANNPYMKPLFAAVYHDYVLCFGRYTFSQEVHDARFAGAIASKHAQQFISGFQFGWSRIPWNLLLDCAPETVRFIRRLARARHEHWRYLACGKMLRPLELTVPAVERRWAMAWNDCEGQVVTLPAVMNSVWQCDDATIAVALVNISAEPQRIQLQLPNIQMDDPSGGTVEGGAENYRYPLPQPTPVRAFLYHGDERQVVVPGGDTRCGIRIELPPESVAMVLLPTEKPYGVHSH